MTDQPCSSNTATAVGNARAEEPSINPTADGNVEQLQARIVLLEEQLQAYQEEIIVTNTKYDVARGLADSWKAEFDNKKKEVYEKQSKIDTLESEVRGLKRNIEDFKSCLQFMASASGGSDLRRKMARTQRLSSEEQNPMLSGNQNEHDGDSEDQPLES